MAAIKTKIDYEYDYEHEHEHEHERKIQGGASVSAFLVRWSILGVLVNNLFDAYTVAMTTAFIIYLIGVGLGQTQSSTLYGAVPEDVATFVWKGGDAVAFRVDKEWVSDLDGPADTQTVEVVQDSPWRAASPTSTLARNIRKAEREYSPARKERLRQGWENAGYVSHTTADGSEVYISAADLEVARQAEQKELEILATWHPKVTANTDQADAPAADTAATKSPGILRRWGGHVVLVLLAGALIGVVVKLLILEG